MIYSRYYDMSKQVKQKQAIKNAEKYLEEEKKRGAVVKTTEELPPEPELIILETVLNIPEQQEQEEQEIYIPENYNDLKSLIKQLIDDGQMKPIKINSSKKMLQKHLKKFYGIE